MDLLMWGVVGAALLLALRLWQRGRRVVELLLAVLATLPLSCRSAGGNDALPPAEPQLPRSTTEWHRVPIVDRLLERNVLVLNHADPSLELATGAAQLQRQYDWLAEWYGFAPRWVIVHVGAGYPFGFALKSGPDPEVFLQVDGIFDTADNYAHEMAHCFTYELGAALPHWFNESLSDMAWLESEIDLWKRRRAAAWLPTLDRIDWRSYELLQLRIADGPGYFPKVLRALWRRRDECRATFDGSQKLDVQNELLLAALSEAAGRDVLPLLRTLGFDPRTRERQRGY